VQKTDKILKMVWLINGFLILLSLCWLIPEKIYWEIKKWSWKEPPREGLLLKKTPAKEYQVLTVKRPIVIEGNPYLLIPVGQKTVREREVAALHAEARPPKGFGQVIGLFNNVIFYRPEDAQTHLLSQTKWIIIGIIYPKTLEEGRFLVYYIAENDDNQDGWLDHQDYLNLYVSDVQGGGLRRLNPPRTRALARWHFIRGEFYVLLQEDVNRDGRFTSVDPQRLVRINPQTGEFRVVTSEELMKRIAAIAFGE